MYNKNPYTKYTFKLMVLFCLLSISCEPNSNIDLENVEKKLVVDAWIENNNFAHVILTYSSGYFSNLDSAAFRGLIASRAKVMVVQANRREVLTLRRDTNYFSQFIYKGTEIVGEPGKKYTLIIENEGDTIISHTTIPKPIELDSVWFSQTTDSSGIIKGIIFDNPDEENYYRVFTRIRSKNKIYVPTLIATYIDSYFNGKKFTFNLNKGPESYLKPYSDIEYKIGDTIFLKIASIDKNSHEFWSAYDQEILNSANPFASNFKGIKSNIHGGLGIWCGYGSTHYLLIAH